MNKRECAIVSAYTGFLIGKFSDMHEYVESVMKRPVFTHEMGGEGFFAQLKELSKKDFVALSDDVKD